MEITREQLIEKLQHIISVASGFPESEKAQMDLELARIALASLEAEAVAFRSKLKPPSAIGSEGWDYTDHRQPDAFELENCVIERLYTAPPAPESVPDGVLKSLLPDAEKSEFWFEHDGKILFEGVKFNNAVFDACRAAMLQGAEPVSNRDELTHDYLQGHKDGLEWAAQLAEANHPQTGDWLYDDPIELAKAIRKGPDMPEADGNSPVVPDGWIPVSERMPEDEQEVLTRNKMGHCFVSFFDEHSGLFFDRIDVAAACCIEHILVTHWMPMPAAPQHEVK